MRKSNKLNEISNAIKSIITANNDCYFFTGKELLYSSYLERKTNVLDVDDPFTIRELAKKGIIERTCCYKTFSGVSSADEDEYETDGNLYVTEYKKKEFIKLYKLNIKVSNFKEDLIKALYPKLDETIKEVMRQYPDGFTYQEEEDKSILYFLNMCFPHTTLLKKEYRQETYTTIDTYIPKFSKPTEEIEKALNEYRRKHRNKDLSEQIFVIKSIQSHLFNARDIYTWGLTAFNMYSYLYDNDYIDDSEKLKDYKVMHEHLYYSLVD